LAADKNKKIDKLTRDLAPEFREPLETVLADQRVVDEKEFARLTSLLVDAFDETMAEAPNEKRMERKLRALLMGLFELKYEGEIEDETLRRAVKFIREKLLRKGEKEKLARLLSKEIISGWLEIDEDMIDHIAGFDGLLEKIQDKAEGDLDYHDPELLDSMLELGHILSANYMRRLGAGELDELLEHSAEVCRRIEAGDDLGDSLLNTVQFGMQHLGIIAMMRRAFAGLLLSDLIVRQIGKSLGIKEKISVTDFIIFVGVKVFEKEHLEDVEKDQVERVRKTILQVSAL